MTFPKKPARVQFCFDHFTSFINGNQIVIRHAHLPVWIGSGTPVKIKKDVGVYQILVYIQQPYFFPFPWLDRAPDRLFV